MARWALLLLLPLLTGCGVGHAIGGYFSPVATMSTDRFAAIRMERALALEYVTMKAALAAECQAGRLPVGVCQGLVQLDRDFREADTLILAQLYDPSTSAFDLGKLTSLIAAFGAVAGATAIQLAPLGL
jgi:hypothetical protein